MGGETEEAMERGAISASAEPTISRTPRLGGASRAVVARINAVLLAERTGRRTRPHRPVPARNDEQPALAVPPVAPSELPAWSEARLPTSLSRGTGAGGGSGVRADEAGTPRKDGEAARRSVHEARSAFELPRAEAISPNSPFALRPGEKTLQLDTEAPSVWNDEATPAAPSKAAAATSRAAPGAPKSAYRTGTSGTRWVGLARRVLRYAAIALAVWLALSVVAIAVFRFVDPPGSTLMLGQWLGGTRVTQRWVPIERVSPQLLRAVVVSEDGRFCRHWGIDPKEILAAIERARDGVPRGASTITMQVAKNLLLWPSKSYLRKALEVPLTLAIEALWPKRRILEVYLNIVEWGPGIFGAEAAARHHFHKPAASLSRREAALLAVTLPNPIQRNAGKPGPGTARLGRLIEARMGNSPHAASCAAP